MNHNYYHLDFYRLTDKGSYSVKNDLRLILVLKGQVYLRFTETCHTLRKNDVEIINFNEPHELKAKTEDSIICILSISEDFINLYAPDIKNRVYNCHTSEFYDGGAETLAIDELKSHMLAIIHSILGTSTHLISDIQKMLELIIDKFDDIHNLLSASDSELKSDRYYNIISYIRLHLNEHIMLNDIEQEVFISKEYISREFKRLFNRSFKEIQAYYRVIKASALLLNTKHSIEQISLEAGFSSKRYFYKYFEKFYKCTPNQLRKEAASFHDAYETADLETVEKLLNEQMVEQTRKSIKPTSKCIISLAGMDKVRKAHTQGFDSIEVAFNRKDLEENKYQAIVHKLIALESKGIMIQSLSYTSSTKADADQALFSDLIFAIRQDRHFNNRLLETIIQHKI